LKKRTFVYLLAILFSSLPALAASFTADLVMTKKGKTETAKFSLLNERYRMEVIEDGKLMVVIADREKNVHRFLNMEEKTFFEIPSDDFRILSNDPFKASEYMVSKYDSKIQGSEKVFGFVCERQDVFAQDKRIHSRWVSNNLKFPVKLVSYEGEKEAYISELKSIRNVRLEKDLFVPPADFKQVEEPGAAAKRKREELKKAEEALPGITKTASARVPCYVKISAGGELRVPIDTDRDAFLDVINEHKAESVYTVLKYRGGKPLEGYEPRQSTLEGKGRHKRWDFNDDFARRTKSSLVDELRIPVAKGLVYANVRQRGLDRSDKYNPGGYQTDVNADPGRPLTLKITGDNPFGDQTKGKFWLRYKAGGSSDAIHFTVANGKMQTWEYPAEKGIKTVAVTISRGDGRAKISLIQPPATPKKISEHTAAKKTSKSKYTPKAKVVTEFTVTHPAGTGKPLTPGKNLLITATGATSGARGTVELFSDAKKKEKIDQFGFTLEKGQAKSHFVPGDKHAVWARVWVYKGSFKVKLDQSPGVKATMKPKPKATSAEKPKPSAKAKQDSVPVAKAAKPATATDAIFNGEVPIYEGARVLKSKTYGDNASASLEVAAPLQEVVDFYKQAMSAQGWTPIMAMVQGDRGAIMFKKENRQLAFKLRGKGDTSKIDIAMMGQ
jgi:outer membrane lipoprotein-sorting protein